MDEIKCVKVDNWGVFFLQKLQNFFNKTDYCDLTLQFRDNSQLKVHRLVLSACTDYFNVLEQTCEVVDDALIMPNELQADVVVPIVNFMYTGTLEFELRMYGKLLRTAKEMNMTVLLKLLEAHRRTMEGVNRAQRPPSPKPPRRRIGPPQQVPQRRVLAASNTSPQRRIVQTKTTGTNASEQPFHYRQQIGNTSLVRTSASGTTPIKIEFEQQSQPPTSPFEQLRKGYNNNKRPSSTSFTSPPAKRPNIEDVKEFAEQQRMRKQIAAEYGDDPEYEGVLDDDIHADDDDDDAGLASGSTAAQQAANNAQPQQHYVKQEPNDNKPPTIVVKDSSNSKMDHSKIIAEVLRQYPHLVRSNKNIKLKILPTVGGAAQKIILKKETVGHQAEPGRVTQQQQQQQQQSPQQLQRQQSPQQHQQQLHAAKAPAAVQIERHVAQTVVTKVAAPSAEAASASSQSGGNPTRRRIDSKTMHNLIALGAENTTGPWLCLRCGVNGRPISIPSYRGFRRHLINTHKESIDSALCEHCGYRSQNHRELHFHIQIEHKIKTPVYTFPECQTCAEAFIDTPTLNQHMISSHPESKQQCIYCNKIFAQELQLFTHMKTYHYKQAVADGIIDETDEEYLDSQPEDQNDEQDSNDVQDTKVKILSDISLPNAETAVANTVPNAANSSGEEFMQTETLTAAEPKFVNEDGTEMVLTEEQRKEIMSHLNQEHETGSVVMLLNDQVFSTEPEAVAAAAAAVANAEEAIHMEQPEGVQTEEDAEINAEAPTPMEEEYDDSQIYKEFLTQKSPVVEAEAPVEIKESDSVNLNASKESAENLEWAENLVLEDEEATNKSIEQKEKSNDDISKKLKELTGDWSEDENDEHEENNAANTTGETMPDDSDGEFIFDAVQKKPEIVEAKATPVESAQAEEAEEELNTAAVAEPDVAKEDTNPDHPDPKIDEDDIERTMLTLHEEAATAEAEPHEDAPILAETEAEADAEETKENLETRKVEEEIAEIINETTAVVDETSETASGEATAAAEATEEVKAEAVDATAKDVEENVELAIQDKKALLDQLMAEVKDEDDENTEAANEQLEEVKNSTEAVTVQHEASEEAVPVEAEAGVEKEAPLTPAQTAEKVKSLISEWGEDDEDMEEAAEAD